MKFWFRIGLSLILAIGSLVIISLLRFHQIPINPTGNFILTIGSSTGLIVGIGLIFFNIIEMALAGQTTMPSIHGGPTENFYSSLTSLLYGMWNIRHTADFYVKAIEYKGKLDQFKERAAKFFKYASDKTWLYFIEDSMKDYHSERLRKMIEHEGYSPEQVGKRLLRDFIEHQKIKDPTDRYNAKKFGLMK